MQRFLSRFFSVWSLCVLLLAFSLSLDTALYFYGIFFECPAPSPISREIPPSLTNSFQKENEERDQEAVYNLSLDKLARSKVLASAFAIESWLPDSYVVTHHSRSVAIGFSSAKKSRIKESVILAFPWYRNVAGLHRNANLSTLALLSLLPNAILRRPLDRQVRIVLFEEAFHREIGSDGDESQAFLNWIEGLEKTLVVLHLGLFRDFDQTGIRHPILAFPLIREPYVRKPTFLVSGKFQDRSLVNIVTSVFREQCPFPAVCEKRIRADLNPSPFLSPLESAGYPILSIRGLGASRLRNEANSFISLSWGVSDLVRILANGVY